VGLRLGVFAVPKEPPVERPEEWFEGALPLPSARLKASGQESWWPALQQVLAEKGLSLDQIRIRGIEKPYFSKGDRAVCLRPRDFQFQSVPDDRHPGRSKVQLNFELPRGCYATMVIKRLTATRPLGDRSGPDVEAGKGE
jgi:tRNA pseudouridine13 synthase